MMLLNRRTHLLPEAVETPITSPLEEKKCIHESPFPPHPSLKVLSYSTPTFSSLLLLL